MNGFLALVLLVLAFLASAFTHSPKVGPCSGAQLTGTFSVIRGSAGAGNISYRLVLKNVSRRACTLTGLPQARLLAKAGKPLPTHVQAASPGALTAILVRLAPGARATATARFTPDVPGPGEPAAGRLCEPTAYWLRITAPGGGTTKAKLAPPTPVCVHGRLLFSAYGTR